MADKKVVAFDIETIADKRMLEHLPDVSAAKNLKDPAKIQADVENKKRKQIMEMALSPLTNMICCVGFCDEKGTGNILLKEESPAGEKALLESVWDVLADYDLFVTFNGRAFDLRCLLLHGVEHGIRPGVNIDKGRYNKPGSNHIDLRPVLAGEDRFAPGTLDFFAEKFLGKNKTEGINGGMVGDYWDMDLKEDIAEYCEDDAKLTYDLFKMVEQAGLIE